MAWMPMNFRQRGSARATLRNPKPLARSQDLVVEELADEVLVYDRTTDRAHCLGVTAARVWRACDGYTTAAVLGTKLDLDEPAIAQALEELEGCGLLDAGPQLGNGSTRREFSMRTAKVGTVAIATPLIMSIAAPVAEATATPTPAQCEGYNDKDCNNCTDICGCCCCCQGSAQGAAACKLCYPIGLCPSFSFPGYPGSCGPQGQSPHCSATAKDPPNCTPAAAHVGCTYVG